MEVTMHPIQLTKAEADVLKGCKQAMDWSDCTTPKLRYLYQRMIAMPAGRYDQVQEIAQLARDNPEYPDDPQKMFSPWYISKGESKLVHGDEVWVDNMTGRKISVKYLDKNNPIIKKQEEANNELVLGRKSE